MLRLVSGASPCDVGSIQMRKKNVYGPNEWLLTFAMEIYIFFLRNLLEPWTFSLRILHNIIF